MKQPKNYDEYRESVAAYMSRVAGQTLAVLIALAVIFVAALIMSGR